MQALSDDVSSDRRHGVPLALVRAVLDGATDKAPLANGYVVDLGAAVQASAFARPVLDDKDSEPATKRSAGPDGDPAGAAGDGVSASLQVKWYAGEHLRATGVRRML